MEMNKRLKEPPPWLPLSLFLMVMTISTAQWQEQKGQACFLCTAQSLRYQRPLFLHKEAGGGEEEKLGETVINCALVPLNGWVENPSALVWQIKGSVYK